MYSLAPNEHIAVKVPSFGNIAITNPQQETLQHSDEQNQIWLWLGNWAVTSAPEHLQGVESWRRETAADMELERRVLWYIATSLASAAYSIKAGYPASGRIVGDMAAPGYVSAVMAMWADGYCWEDIAAQAERKEGIDGIWVVRNIKITPRPDHLKSQKNYYGSIDYPDSSHLWRKGILLTSAEGILLVYPEKKGRMAVRGANWKCVWMHQILGSECSLPFLRP